jgi:hypothetical protein
MEVVPYVQKGILLILSIKNVFHAKVNARVVSLTFLLPVSLAILDTILMD